MTYDTIFLEGITTCFKTSKTCLIFQKSPQLSFGDTAF